MADNDKKRRKAELAAAAALLLLEQRAQATLRGAVGVSVRHLSRIGAPAGHIDRAIRMTAKNAVLKIRAGARTGSREAWETTTGLALPDAAVAAEEGRAIKTAESLAEHWKTSLADAESEATAAVARGEEAADPVDVAIEAVEVRAESVATTEVVDSWNRETRQLNDYAADVHGEGHTEWWSSVIDLRTCDQCASLDGTSVTRPEQFDAYPPLHINCRCFVTAG